MFFIKRLYLKILFKLSRILSSVVVSDSVSVSSFIFDNLYKSLIITLTSFVSAIFILLIRLLYGLINKLFKSSILCVISFSGFFSKHFIWYI